MIMRHVRSSFFLLLVDLSLSLLFVCLLAVVVPGFRTFRSREREWPMTCGTLSLLLLLLLFFNHLLLISSSSSFTGKPNGVCISQGGRFPPFSSEGKAPRKVTKGPKDLTLCRVFRRRTCCDVAQTHQAFVTIRRLASLGEANEECLQLWELLECSICDPRVGVQPGPPLICASLCDSVYKACSNAYFSIDMKTQVLSPCGLSNLVCGRVSEWASNGTELCHLAGFAIKSSEDSYQTGKEPSCYGGKASLDSIADSWKSSYSGIPQKTENFGSFEDFQQWVREMPFNERVSWAIGGMVLTAGLLFVSKRRSHARHQREVTLLWTARRLEAKMNPQSPPVSPGNRKKGSGR